MRAPVGSPWFRTHLLPALLWGGAIFVSSSIASADLPKLDIWSADKIVHFGVYFVLAALVHRALRHPAAPKGVREHHLLVMIVVTALYGLSDEIHQSFVPGRNPSLLDLLADAGGAVLYALLFLLWNRHRPRAGGSPSRN